MICEFERGTLEKATSNLRTFMLSTVLNFVFQRSCPLCSRSACNSVCRNCQDQLTQERFDNPAQFWTHEPRIFAWGSYADTLKHTIARLKYDQQPQLATLLGVELAQAWINHPVSQRVGKVSIVPIPLHREKQRQRGYNQAELIARAFCRVTGDPLYAHGLERIRATEALFGLSAVDRENTLTEAFNLGKDFQHRRVTTPILLIDDIYTTGATVRTAVQVLHRHRMQVAGVAVVARTLQWKNRSR